MNKTLIYEDDAISLFKIIEEVSKEDEHFSTITYSPTGDYLEILEKRKDSVVVEYYHKQPKIEKHLYIYNCKKVIIKTPEKFIPYNCADGYKEEVGIDGCLEEEIKELWNNGVVTTGCCCGHGMELGFIQVRTKEDVEKMEQLGYQHYIYEDKYGGVERKDAFIPKTTKHIYDGYSDGFLG